MPTDERAYLRRLITPSVSRPRRSRCGSRLPAIIWATGLARMTGWRASPPTNISRRRNWNGPPRWPATLATASDPRPIGSQWCSTAALGDPAAAERAPARNVVPTGYDLRFLNVDQDLPKLIAALQRRPHGIFCFHGPAGTGKSELARHIADRLEKPLLVKRA
ncbi:MAG: hypothetical protein U1F42_03160 [Candidatus Competibacteraceae bacterium]